ncbi:cytochrome P450 4C1-like [Sabethes cyaneus]|uniref:cytochrome P450 4C1-like n=1 Tax=Sabethes cyaneus TaxID=53552 RepID=UPI00237EB6FA|nr:cytochrome P450 4C1-like [Sabethes cyaneus]
MIQWIHYFLCAIGMLLFVIHILQTIDRRGRIFRALNKFAGPPIRPIIGTLTEVLFLNQATTFQRARAWPKRYGGSYRFWGSRWTAVLNVVRVREAEPLLASVKNIDKSRFYKFLHPFLGLGLLNSKGSKWMHRRRILTPTFHFNILNGFHQTFLEECEQLISTLSCHASSGKTTDLRPIMSRFTLSTICETSMGVKLSSISGADEYRQKLYRIGELLLYRLMHPWMHIGFIWKITGYNRALNKLLRPVHAFTTSIINQRRAQFKQISDHIEDLTEENIYMSTRKRYAMLDSLLLAEQKQQIDEEGVREEVDTFTFEGHDTTASALVFIFFTLAREPAVQERIYEEISAVRANKTSEATKWFSPQDYTEMKFMDRAIKECLRLWPPVPFISRAVTEDIVLSDGNIIPAGVLVNVHIFDLHRDPEQFPDPDEFDADRFLPENVERRNPYAYVPFSAGPRNCIGQKYAMMELKAVVAHTLLQFKVLPVTRLEEINFVADLVIRSTNPIEVRFVARS